MFTDRRWTDLLDRARRAGKAHAKDREHSVVQAQVIAGWSPERMRAAREEWYARITPADLAWPDWVLPPLLSPERTAWTGGHRHEGGRCLLAAIRDDLQAPGLRECHVEVLLAAYRSGAAEFLAESLDYLEAM